ncbi:hypothetical protein N573_004535 [Limosilactobacillus fermentum 3872]|uniref:Uncharacterized protein n=1 Tax=Limosilactobacillus fermentum 3872 TaxID=1381124 RepID=A0A806TAM1_LIMFE|nr:hypothetical protein [Limosilactobacillus fermentum]AKM50994.1 hypothetical protein N573_004385 [Limosilactobacillus fermentum 3872]AKM51024.1 hypothetical protein N573_004535 [Limosilactobacillus fermentum 3872]
MLGLIFKTILFFSSYIPIFVMIFLNNLDSFSNNSIEKTWNQNPSLWLSMIILSVITLIILFIWIKILKDEAADTTKQEYQLEDLRKYDSEVLNFFVTFIIPILSLEPKSGPSIVMNLILVIIEGIYYISNNALYFNVILIILGYHVYTFSNDNIVISRKTKDQLFISQQASQIGTTNIFYA